MPSEIDFSIAEICPEDFDVNENIYDSDGQRRRVQLNNANEYEDNELVLDPATGTFIFLESLQSTTSASICEEPPAGPSSLVRPLEEKSDEPVPKRRKKEMTSYEESAGTRRRNLKKTMEFMQIEHKAKIQAILAEQKQKQELHELNEGIIA